MTTRLRIYNGALLLLGERELASLSENREPRFNLDQVWNDDGVRYCLEQGQWHFAIRVAKFDFDASAEPDFGFARGFTKPTDWVNTSGIFQDEDLQTPLTRYADEVGFWYADVDEIYVRYVSDDASYGGDLSRWPASFTDYVKAYFASRIVHKLTGSAERRDFLLGPVGRENRGYVNRTLLIAKNKAAMALPTTFPSRGTWTAARHRGLVRTRDGGSSSQLIG